MASEGFALGREELKRALTAHSGVTTADGSASKNTLIDSALIGKNDFLSGKSVLIMSGDAQYETAGVTSFNSTTGEITVGDAFSAQIMAGVSFRVLNTLPESIHITSGQVQIMGYDYESGEWRKVRVTSSGEVAIHVTVADIVTAKISGESVVVTSGQVDVYIMSGAVMAISGEVVAKVSGEAVKISGQAVKVSGETVATSVSGNVVGAKVSGETVIAKISGETVIAKISGETVVAEVSGEQVRLQGYELVSGDWRNVLVNASGQIIARISGDVVKVSGEALKVSGEAVKVSGETLIAKISGETVIAKISGETVIAKVSGETVKISGETVVAEVSGEQIRIEGYDLLSGEWRKIVVNASGEVIARVSGEAIKVSGETIITKISGETVIAKVSGETLISKVSGETIRVSGEAVKVSGETLIAKISGETVIAKISGETIKISGETVTVATPTTNKTMAVRTITGASGGEVLHSGSVKSVMTKALVLNSGDIYIGGATDRPYSGFGFLLAAGEVYSQDASDFDNIYVLAVVSGDKVSALGVA